MDGMITSERKADIQIFRHEQEDNAVAGINLFSAKTEQETRKVMKTGENKSYYSAIVKIKKKLDDDNESDDTGTYTELKRLVTFFVENYKYFDETTEVRMITTLHARAVDYYNLHRGYRFTMLGKSRKNSANQIISELQDAIMNMPEDMKLEALSQLSSFEHSPKIFANEKEYKTEVGLGSKTVNEFMERYARDVYAKQLIKKGTLEAQAKQMALDNPNINAYTGYIQVVKEKRSYVNDVLQKDVVPEEFDSVRSYLRGSMYESNGETVRLPALFNKFYLRDKDGNPVRETDGKKKAFNRRVLDILKSNDPEQVMELVDHLAKKIIDYKIPDFSTVINENNEIPDKEAALKFLARHFEGLREATLLATGIQNLLMAKENDANKMDSPVYRTYFERYSEEMRQLLNSKANALVAIVSGLMPFFSLCGGLDINSTEIASEGNKHNYNSVAPMLAVARAVDVRQVNKNFDFEMGLNRNVEEYANLHESTNAQAIETSATLSIAANEYVAQKEIYDTRRKTAYADKVALRKCEFFRDKKLQNALLLLMPEIEKEAFDGLVSAFVNKDDERIEAILTDIFSKLENCSVNYNNYANTNDIDMLLHNRDITEAILLLSDYFDVKRVIKPEDLSKAVNRAKMINGYCELALLKISGKTEEEGLKKLQLAAMRKIAEGKGQEHGSDEEMENTKIQFINVKSKIPTVQFVENAEAYNAVMAENERQKAENPDYIPVYPENLEGDAVTYLTEHMMEYFGSEDVYFKMQDNIRLIDKEIKRFGEKKCIVYGKYPVPTISECTQIKEKGTFEQKFALMMCISVFSTQSVDMATDGYKERALEDRNLQINNALKDKYVNLLDELNNELSNAENIPANKKQEHFKKLAEYQISYEYRAKLQFADQIEKHLYEMGKDINNATQEDFAKAFLQAYVDGYDIVPSIMSRTVNMPGNEYFQEHNLAFGVSGVSRLQTFAHMTKVYEKMNINSIEDVRVIYRNRGEEGRREYEEATKQNAERVTAELMAAGLVGDAFVVGLSNDITRALQLTDSSEKHNKGNENTFYKLVTIPFGQLIKESAIDLEGNHSEKYISQYNEFIASLDKYIHTHNPHSTIGHQRLDFVNELKAKLEANLGH